MQSYCLDSVLEAFAHDPVCVGVMNYYQELTTDGYLFKNAQASIGADLLRPWVDLYKRGQENGIKFVTVDQVSNLAEMDAIIFIDRPRPGDPVVEELMSANIVKYLLLYECEVIKPDNWDLDYHKQFDRVLTWSDVLVDGERYIKTNFAISTEPAFDFAELKSNFGRRKLVTLIAGAKASVHPYEALHRVRTIRWFEATAPDDFDLYGHGWDVAVFPSYRGSTADKLLTLSQYRFAICYENACNIPGYITEKLLDCLRAGVVPVYGGAPNISRWVPSECFISIENFASYFDLYECLHKMDATTHTEYLDNIASSCWGRRPTPFPQSVLFKPWSSLLLLTLPSADRKRAQRATK